MKKQTREEHHQQLADALLDGVNWHDPLTPSISFNTLMFAHWSRNDISGNEKEEMREAFEALAFM